MAGLVCCGQGTNPSLALSDPAAIQENLLRANNYFLSHDSIQTNGWARGVYHTGNMRAYQILGVDQYLQSAIQWGTLNRWQPGIRGGTNADGEVCGQTYVDLYIIDPQPVRIAAMKSAIDERVAAASAVQDWWWIDSFFMAGPVFARFGNLEATNSYFDKMWLMYDDMKTRRALFDPAFGLWYRDAAAKTATTRNGHKQFWGRGNGWVLAGLARVLEQMGPAQPHRNDFITMMRTMAAALKPLQGADGMWRSSLLDAAEFPNPETSCTALFTYGLAWGIRHDYLSSADYGPVVARAWGGMVTNALHSDGLVGYVQPQGRLPDAATYDNTEDFGVGTFLLAGSEVLLLGGAAPSVPILMSQPTNQVVAMGGTVQLSETAVGAPPLKYQWFRDGLQLAGATNLSLTLSNARTNDAGNYHCEVINSFGNATSRVAIVTVLTLPGAMNTPNWIWTTGGNSPWTPQGSVTHDGVSAMLSGNISDSQMSWLETALSGPATVAFWWKVSSETNKDFLRLYVNGVEQMRISGEVDWQRRSLSVAASNQVLRWSYSKNSSTAKGQDRGWLDQAGINCNYALTPVSRVHGPGVETGLVNIMANNSLCTWTLLNTNSWITLTSDSSGAGNGSVNYSLAANPTAIGRTGVLMLADQTFTISQAGAPCAYQFSPTNQVYQAGGGTGVVNILTIPGCDWKVTSTNDWITLSSSPNGMGDGSINYAVAANPSASARIGFLRLADQIFIITNVGNISLSCPSDKVVECASDWNFDTPTVASGCPDTNLFLQVSSTVTNMLGFCANTFTAVRNWEAVDGCSNRATCSQRVTVVDTTPPALTCAGDKTVEAGSAWGFDPPSTTDVCSGPNVTLGEVNTLTNRLGFCGGTFSATRTWEAMDGCSNRATCKQTVTLEDRTAPLLSCAAMKGIICAVAWSFDDPITSDAADGTNVTLTVLDTVTNGSCGQTLVATRTWMATDRCGNSSTCSQAVTNLQIVISGMISYATRYPSATPSDKRLGAVAVNLTGDVNQTTQTANDGSYNFTVNAGTSFLITPEGVGDEPAGNGITTLDISAIRQQILNIARLDSPYKLLAADVNGSGSVTTVDVLRLRQVILGLTNTFSVGSWRLVASDYVFPDLQSPWDAPSGRSYTNLMENRSNQDFFAIKVGDVNNSWTPPARAASSKPVGIK